jgi:predicted ester cyclase
MDETTTTRELEAFYRRYNRLCNEHRFDELGTFVAHDVEVNGRTQGLDGYVRGLEAVVRAFPDYRWDLRHLVIDAPVIAAHFVDTGKHEGTFLGVPPTGRSVTTQEFAVYRVAAGRIAQVWVTADNLELLRQLRDGHGGPAGHG